MASNGQNQSAESKVASVRELFETKHKGDIEAKLYDDRDIQRYREDDAYVATFIRSFETLQDACNHLHEAFKFRKEFEMNDATPESFEQEIWDSGAVYYHNHDKDGHTILYIEVKQHKKEPAYLPKIKKFVAFMLESYAKKHPGKTIVLLFDLDGAGLAHLDMELIKHIISCFKMYYPILLEYMLMYEMPWLFNAAWKVIKQMLHAESVKRIKFVTKANIQEYVDKDQLWEHMGGTDRYVYKYHPASFDIEGDGDDDDLMDTMRKRVTFADQDGDMYRSMSSDSLMLQEANGAIPKQEVMNENRNASGGGIMRRGPPGAPSTRRAAREDNSFIGRLLTICPAEELEFVIDDDTKESCDNIVLKNTLPYSIAYKVKTTSPEKYRVRPSSGFVKPGTESEVSIYLQQGYQNTVHKDKFLIMAMEVANESNKSFNEIWKAVQKDSIMEHRLRCVVTSKDSGDGDKDSLNAHKTPILGDIAKKVDVVLEQNTRLRRTVQYLIVSQVLLTMVLVALAVFWLWVSNGSSNSSSESDGTCSAVEKGVDKLCS